MTASGSKSLPAIGFLTVSEHAEHGLFGGYLVLNTSGRPLEFHCTAPVKPNRAQEILYGRTLKPFLYGEQIGQTLLSKAKVQPLLVCTDVEPALSVREFCPSPVVLVLPPPGNLAAAEGSEALALRRDAGHAGVVAPPSSRFVEFALGQHQVAVASACQADRPQVVECWQPYAQDFDLLEPFLRIRDALEEAQRTAR